MKIIKKKIAGFSALLSIFFTLLLLTGCPTGSGSGSTTTTTATSGNLAIGDTYGGGIVAYILVSGDPGYDPAVQHGLIAATEDQSTGIIWVTAGKQNTAVNGTLTTLGSGSANTDKIIAQNGAGTTYAAGLARAYNGGGFDDWYLPSLDELNKLYLNKDVIGGFAGNHFWSSSEKNATLAFFQFFSIGSQIYYGKYNTLYVRAVRSF
jgi:hypothetical protein